MADAAIYISLVEIYYGISGVIYCNLHFCVYLCKGIGFYTAHKIFFLFLLNRKNIDGIKRSSDLVNTNTNFIDIINVKSNKR